MKNSSLALKNGSANDAKRRGPPRDEVRREGERMSSPRPQIAKGNRTAGEPRTDRPSRSREITTGKIIRTRGFLGPAGGAWGGEGSVQPPPEDADFPNERRRK